MPSTLGGIAFILGFDLYFSRTFRGLRDRNHMWGGLALSSGLRLYRSLRLGTGQGLRVRRCRSGVRIGDRLHVGQTDDLLDDHKLRAMSGETYARDYAISLGLHI